MDSPKISSTDLWILVIGCLLLVCVGFAICLFAMAIGFSWPTKDLGSMPWIVVAKCLLLFLLGVGMSVAGGVTLYQFIKRLLE